jgi:hypothetical protein
VCVIDLVIISSVCVIDLVIISSVCVIDLVIISSVCVIDLVIISSVCVIDLVIIIHSKTFQGVIWFLAVKLQNLIVYNLKDTWDAKLSDNTINRTNTLKNKTDKTERASNLQH